jgi:hypothetical protein
MNKKGRVNNLKKILNPPIYGPNSPFFWPGIRWHAREFAICAWLNDSRSTKDCLKEYEDACSGVEGYIENNENRDEEYIEKLYVHFHKLYDSVESWPYLTFFVSPLYKIIFDEIFPYQSNQYDVTKSSLSNYQ